MRGHANLLCIVPILSDVPEGTNIASTLPVINQTQNPILGRCGTRYTNVRVFSE
ncbi:hypothetical protein Hanom_Chr04g00290601 [Helianthus anomalus]